jgi:hypothetical protein
LEFPKGKGEISFFLSDLPILRCESRRRDADHLLEFQKQPDVWSKEFPACLICPYVRGMPEDF